MPRDSLVAGSVASGETGRSFGRHRAMDNAGAIPGPALAYFILAAFPEDYRIGVPDRRDPGGRGRADDGAGTAAAAAAAVVLFLKLGGARPGASPQPPK